MTEKEKRDAGLTYRSSDAVLAGEVLACHELCCEYNLLRPAQEREAYALLRRILGRVGRNSKFLQPFLCDYGYNISVGDDVWFGGGVTVVGGVTVGSGSVIGVGSVVVRDVPPGVLAAGNPCRVIRSFGPESRGGCGGRNPAGESVGRG